MSRQQIKWTLFVALFVSAPTLFFLVIAIGVVPAVGLILAGLDALRHTRGDLMELGFILIFFIYAVVWAALYLYLSSKAATYLERFNAPVRTALTAISVALILGMSFLPLCQSRSVHSRRNPISWIDLLREYQKSSGPIRL